MTIHRIHDITKESKALSCTKQRNLQFNVNLLNESFHYCPIYNIEFNTFHCGISSNYCFVDDDDDEMEGKLELSVADNDGWVLGDD